MNERCRLGDADPDFVPEIFFDPELLELTEEFGLRLRPTGEIFVLIDLLEEERQLDRQPPSDLLLLAERLDVADLTNDVGQRVLQSVDLRPQELLQGLRGQLSRVETGLTQDDQEAAKFGQAILGWTVRHGSSPVGVKQ